MLKKILSFFTGGCSGNTEDSPAAAPRHSCCSAEKGSVEELINFVDFVVRHLVSEPSAVRIELDNGDKGQTINIHCKKEDIGKVIGRNGKTIMAIRSLVAGAGSRQNKQVTVEVVD